MQTRALVLLAAPLLAITSIAGLASQPAATPAVSPAPESLANFAFLEGTWRGGENGELTEETWSREHHGKIVGMFRWVGPDGDVRLYEMLAIAAEADATRLRLRHFDDKLVGWKSEADTNSAMTFALKESTATKAVFENESAEGDLKGVTYTASGADGLKIEVLFRNAQRQPLAFNLKRHQVTPGPR